MSQQAPKGGAAKDEAGMSALDADHWRSLGSSVVGDALRARGRAFQCMEGGIGSIAGGMALAGPAFTVRTYPGATWALEQSLEHAAPGDVLVVDAGGRPDVIIMGELMSMRAQQRGIAGAVVDGAVRDVAEIATLGFPLFARHICPRSGTHERIGEWQVPIACGRVVVSPGDWVVADASGVTVVPADECAAVAETAGAIKRKETAIARHLQAGMDIDAAAREAERAADERCGM